MQRKTISRRDFFRAGTPSTARTPAIPLTPNGDFYRQQLRHIPRVDPTYWAFTLGGLVARPQVFAHEAFMRLPAVEQPATLTCIGSTASSPMIGHALWRGVPLAALLDDAGVQPGATHLQVYAADGYTTFIQLNQLENAILAYEMNGAPLPPEHGFPVRLVVPGLYGYKMPKWLQRVQVTDSPVDGFWESRGWSATGEAQVTSAILHPRHLTPVSGPVLLSGVAYAGAQAVTQVEVSIDHGPWMPVPFAPGAAYSWTAWEIPWTPPTPGDYLVRVRAADSSGRTQPDETAAFPNGPSAVQAVIVRVTA